MNQMTHVSWVAEWRPPKRRNLTAGGQTNELAASSASFAFCSFPVSGAGAVLAMGTSRPMRISVGFFVLSELFSFCNVFIMLSICWSVYGGLLLTKLKFWFAVTSTRAEFPAPSPLPTTDRTVERCRLSWASGSDSFRVRRWPPATNKILPATLCRTVCGFALAPQ